MELWARRVFNRGAQHSCRYLDGGQCGPQTSKGNKTGAVAAVSTQNPYFLPVPRVTVLPGPIPCDAVEEVAAQTRLQTGPLLSPNSPLVRLFVVRVGCSVSSPRLLGIDAAAGTVQACGRVRTPFAA